MAATAAKRLTLWRINEENKRIKAMKKIVVAALLIFIIIAAFAHEYILLASKFKVAKADTLELHLFVADGFNIELERPLQTGITKRFELLSENGNSNLLNGATDGTIPIIKTAVDFEGLALVHMERDYAKITLPTSKFISYLKEDHIENIKVKKDAAKLNQTERYTRYIKCLVQSGDIKKDTLYKTVVGHNFEIVLLQNPYTLHHGNTLKAKILFMGKPLTNKLITARNRTGSQPVITLTARTDAKGICLFPISRNGDWFIHATHMIACPNKAEADWESFWASYSFGIE